MKNAAVRIPFAALLIYSSLSLNHLSTELFREESVAMLNSFSQSASAVLQGSSAKPKADNFIDGDERCRRKEDDR